MRSHPLTLVTSLVLLLLPAIGIAAERPVTMSMRSRTPRPSETAQAMTIRGQRSVGKPTFDSERSVSGVEGSSRPYHPTPAVPTPAEHSEFASEQPGVQAEGEIPLDSTEFSEGEGAIVGEDCASCSGGLDEGEWGDDGACGGERVRLCTRWSAGVEFTLLQPYFESNPAILRRDSNNAGLDTLSETNFDYGTNLAPRVWLETIQGDSLGFRVIYWQFDQAADPVTQSPPANGFGRIQPPPFGTIDLSTTTPASVLTAASDLNAYTIDVEATQCFNSGVWGCTAAAGVRYGEVDQAYQTRLTNAAGNAQGRLDFSHRVQGAGPTLALRTQRPFLRNFSLFGQARGSLLFGDGETSLNAIEDQDLANPLTTNVAVTRDDLLPVGELQLGLQYTPCSGCNYPYLHIAMEGQLWQGAGNASSEDGNLGFFGANIALGFDW